MCWNTRYYAPAFSPGCISHCYIHNKITCQKEKKHILPFFQVSRHHAGFRGFCLPARGSSELEIGYVMCGCRKKRFRLLASSYSRTQLNDWTHHVPLRAEPLFYVLRVRRSFSGRPLLSDLATPCHSIKDVVKHVRTLSCMV